MHMNERLFSLFISQVISLLVVFLAIAFLPNSILAQSALRAYESAFASDPQLRSSSFLVSSIPEHPGQAPQILASSRAELPLKPASILKVLTSAVALQELGPEYRFPTQLYAAGQQGQGVERLYVRGSGDPAMTTETLWILARSVRNAGIRQVAVLVGDDTSFVGNASREGQRAYEAASSALSLNFNSVELIACPSFPGAQARVFAEPFEFAQRAGVHILNSVQTGSGKASAVQFQETSCSGQQKPCAQSFQASGHIGQGASCGRQYRSVQNPRHYFLTTLRGFLEAVGVQVGSIETGSQRTPGTARLLSTHESKALAVILRDLNQYSSNFIAEQILMALGAQTGSREFLIGQSFHREIGKQRMVNFLQGRKVWTPGSVLEDASGLSHANRLSAKSILSAMLFLLSNEKFRPEFESSLAVLGQSGTLKRRKSPEPGLFLRGKTGTLNGVKSLAGTLRSRSGRVQAFVLIQNNAGTHDKQIQTENKLLRALASS